MTKDYQQHFGTVSIVLGLLLCTYGASIVTYIFMAVVSVGLLITMNLYAYNILLSVEASIPKIVLMAIFVSVVSVFLSRFVVNFARKWAVLLVSTWLGLIAVMTVFNFKTNASSIIVIDPKTMSTLQEYPVPYKLPS